VAAEIFQFLFEGVTPREHIVGSPQQVAKRDRGPTATQALAALIREQASLTL
jgi:hypothetical protein